MRVKHEKHLAFDEVETEVYDVEDYVFNKTLKKERCGRDFDYTESVRLEDQPAAVCKLVSRLIDTLLEKKLIDAKDFTKIIGDYEEVEIIEND